eukprot:GHRQ01019359.1.p1 GENE.GHRQ01019359.1~~GHRQ01019359.1.p1  ORF type:complete len:366 (+),score=150.20 GHRQ01019359.1:917-2014(+)
MPHKACKTVLAALPLQVACGRLAHCGWAVKLCMQLMAEGIVLYSGMQVGGRCRPASSAVFLQVGLSWHALRTPCILCDTALVFLGCFNLLLFILSLCRTGAPLDEVYGQDVLFVANDWHAGLLPLLLTARFRPYGVYANARCCLAIHNLAHQGSHEASRFHDIGLSGDWYSALEWQDPGDKQRKKTINVLKAGIVTSDLLLTVSQGYAAEITGMPQDARVDMLLAQRANKLRGIVNGIDINEWDPETDKHLAATYSAYDLSGKAVCKRALQREMRLPLEPDMPLVGFIGRLDYQKGPDLLLDALPTLANLECQVVLLGSGAADYEARLKEASHEFGWCCRGHVGFSVPLSHKIIAGCDILLMPSR